MENIGNILKKSRKEQGKTLEEINEQTKISLEHLNLLEKNDYSFLPETYVKSFIKNYAIALGLDGDELVDLYAQKQEKKKKHNIEYEKEAETRPSSSKQKAIGWALGIGTIVLLISLILVYFQYKSQIHAQPAESLQNFLSKENALAEIGVQEVSFSAE